MAAAVPDLRRERGHGSSPARRPARPGTSSASTPTCWPTSPRRAAAAHHRRRGHGHRPSGQGLALADHPADRRQELLDPGLLDARCPAAPGADGRLEVHVAARVPAEAIGAGAGMISEYANTDLMGAYAGLGDDLSLGLESLRVGDIVALADHDHRYGRGYRPGYLTIGVISHRPVHAVRARAGSELAAVSGPAEAFSLVDDPDANLASWYHDPGWHARTAEGSAGDGRWRGRGQPARLRRASGARRQPVPGDADGEPTSLSATAASCSGSASATRSSRSHGDHAAPGACLVHPDPAARHALAALFRASATEAVVRTGAAAGASGAVIGKRGEDGPRDRRRSGAGDLARMRPGDQVSVRALRPGLPAGLAARRASRC